MTPPAKDHQGAADAFYQVEVLSHEVKRMANDVATLAGNMAKLTEQMTRLVLAEERISQVTAAQAEDAKEHKAIGERITRIELALVKLQGSSKWVDMAVTGALVFVGSIAANKMLH